MTERRRNFSAVSFADRYILAIGGENEIGQLLASVEIYDMQEAVPPMPVARYNFAVSVLNNSLVLMGGWNPYTAEDIKRVDFFPLATSRSLPIFETSCI